MRKSTCSFQEEKVCFGGEQMTTGPGPCGKRLNDKREVLFKRSFAGSEMTFLWFLWAGGRGTTSLAPAR